MKIRILVIFCLAAVAAQAGVTNFDSIAASCCFSDVYPGTGRGPFLDFGWMTITGGAVMSNDGWGGVATTAPNLYGTSDMYPLGDYSWLPGFITMTFASPVSDLTFDVINGYYSSSFTATAYDLSATIVDVQSVNLGCYSCSGSIGAIALAGQISMVVLVSGQGSGVIDFAVDTIQSGAVPEPGTFALTGLALAGWIFGVRRRRR